MKRGLWSCSGCDERWSSLIWEHCPDCHETFKGTGAGDKHRTPDFRCVSPEAAGLVRNRHGAWGFPMDAGYAARLAERASERTLASQD